MNTVVYSVENRSINSRSRAAKTRVRLLDAPALSTCSMGRLRPTVVTVQIRLAGRFGSRTRMHCMRPHPPPFGMHICRLGARARQQRTIDGLGPIHPGKSRRSACKSKSKHDGDFRSRHFQVLPCAEFGFAITCRENAFSALTNEFEENRQGVTNRGNGMKIIEGYRWCDPVRQFRRLHEIFCTFRIELRHKFVLRPDG